MKAINYFIAAMFVLFIMVSITSCDKKEEQKQITPQKEISSDKDQELKQKEEFLKLKEEQLKLWEEKLLKLDSNKGRTLKDTIVKTPEGKDTLKAKEKVEVQETNKEKKLKEKEKELNKKVDNPKAAIDDYLEYLQRGIGDSKTFDANMTKASQIWENRTADAFKKNYKGTKKLTITEEPSIVLQKGGTASVKVKIKQTITGKDGKEEEKETTVTYNMVADKNGKWRIKNNVVK